MSEEEINCPNCNSSKHVHLISDYQKMGTAIGSGVGGVAGYYGKLNCLVGGAEIGASIGTALIPGIGTALGAATGGITGAALGLLSGGAIGNCIGDQVDKIIAKYHCRKCKITFNL